MSLLQLPTLGILFWIVYRISFVEKRVGNIESLLHIPVQSLVASVKRGELTLSEQAKKDLPGEIPEDQAL